MNDRITSWLRTITPKVWGATITALLVWLAIHAPWIIDGLNLLEIDLLSAPVLLVVDTIVTAAWYAAWRWVEPRLPAWLTKTVLGSAKAPTYVAPSTAVE